MTHTICITVSKQPLVDINDTMLFTICNSVHTEQVYKKQVKKIPVGARFFAHVQTALGLTQPLVQWVLGLSRG
jgi:hypothetical protein